MVPRRLKPSRRFGTTPYIYSFEELNAINPKPGEDKEEREYNIE